MRKRKKSRRRQNFGKKRNKKINSYRMARGGVRL